MTFGEPLDDFDYWRLCDELSVFQAALLTIGISPSDSEGAYSEEREVHARPFGYEAAKTAISNALKKGYIAGDLVSEHEYDINGNFAGAIEGSINIKESTVDVDSLVLWLADRGLKTGFFARDISESADYLDPKHPRYAPKLAAAVKAWLAIEDPAGRHPKQALTKWLREHASKFGLSDEEGKPNETGIEEAAKVANWQPGGGAPKTPS
jgi:hypothetical protein